jgi:ABC-type glycerol-3-phosphate transport system substrate-binding protein
MKMAHYPLVRLLFFLALMWPVLGGCTPPTPPPSPTPWPTTTDVGLAAATPTPEPATATHTPYPTPTATFTVTPTRPPLLDTAGPEPVVITVWENLPPAQSAQLAVDIDTFQEQFAQYRVEQRSYTDSDAFLAAVVSGQTGFDIVLASPELLGGLWLADKLVPMSDLFPPSFLDSFAAVVASGATAEGQLWGLPETAGFQLMLFYNRALVDTPPATIEEMVAFSDTVREDGRTGLVMNSYDPLWLIPWLSFFDGWVADDQRELTLNSPAMPLTIELYTGWFPEVSPLTTYDEALTQFVAGEAAMLISGDWTGAQLNNVGQVDWGVAMLPRSEDIAPVPLVLSTYWAVGRDANRERAVAVATFLEFITQPQRQLTRTAKFGTLPGRREALDDPLIVTDAIRRVSAGQLRAGRMLPLGVSTNLVLDSMREPLRQVLDGSLTAEEAAEQMQTNATGR